MISFTSDFFLRQVRIVLFWLSGVLVGKGVIEGSTAEWAAGAVMQAAAWAWSLWGNRIVAKVNELVKVKDFVVIAPPEVAAAVPSPSAVSSTEATVVVPPSTAAALKMENPHVDVVVQK